MAHGEPPSLDLGVELDRDIVAPELDDRPVVGATVDAHELLSVTRGHNLDHNGRRPLGAATD
jgi:hypothetical protein